MEQTGFIVGIDIGTSKIIGLLGRKNEQGVVSILASESIPSDSCVKHGVVYNIDETAGKIKKIISLLENKTGRKIGKVYVSVAGMSLRAMEYSVIKDFGSDTEVQFSVIDQMENQARMNKPDFMTNYSVVAPEFFIDGEDVEDPLGKQGTVLEGRYRLIVGRPNIKTNLIKCITEKNQLEIAGFIVGPVAAGAIVLDEADKQKGCVLIDFGAGTTTLSIYKGGLLRYMAVVPFGGRTITKDIQELGFVDTTAEAAKLKYGRVGKDKNNKLQPISSSDIDIKELNKVIQLREDEIVLNVLNQIKESGYHEQLEAGAILIGGASLMKGLPEFLEEKLGIPVKKGIAKRLYINNAADLLQNPAYTQCLGLLLFANENCEKKEITIERPKPEVQEPLNIRPTTAKRQPQPQVEEEYEEEEYEEEYEEEEEIEEKPKRKKEPKKQKTLFDFFGKIQNLGGTMFKDED